MSNSSASPQSVLITGASSGIGAALAKAYAGPGMHLALNGRNWERLAEVAEACEAAGATVRTRHLDVLHRTAMADWIADIDQQAPLDLVIANAGVSAGTGSGTESDAQTHRILAINIDGVVNTVLPVVRAMKARRRGQIAIVSSLAGFRGFPGAPAYCASKAAVRVWGESLRGHLKADGIGISVICPGFVKSRMTAVNEFPMPFLLDSDKAAAKIRRGLARNKPRIAFPWQLAAGIWLLNALPQSWTDPLLTRLPEKDG